MRLTIVEPIVRPEHSTYLVENTMVCIQVGLGIPQVNLLDAVEQCQYTLLDAHGEVLQEGSIDVDLGSFNSSITFDGLERDTFYVFRLENRHDRPNGKLAEATLVTGHIQDTVDETTIFPEIADLATTGTLAVISNAHEMTKSVRFRDGLGFGDLGDQTADGSIIGRSIVLADGRLLAFRPTILRTCDRTIARTIRYAAFVGLPYRSVAVVQHVSLTLIGHRRYAVDPPANLVVKLGNSVVLVSHEPLEFLDLSRLAIPIGSAVTIQQV